MNPYTYHKPKKAVGQAQTGPTSSPKGGGSWLSEIINAKISSAIALAFVIFAAGATGSIVAVASSEIAIQGSEEAQVQPVVHSVNSKVLGVSIDQVIIDDSALEAGDPSGNVVAKPLAYDSNIGRWNYKINFGVENINSPATLSIGNYIVKSGITSSGTIETGYILKPSRVYQLSLWTSDLNSGKIKLAKFQIKTGKSQKTSPVNPQPLACQQSEYQGSVLSSTASSEPVLCVKKENGEIACMTKQCEPYELKQKEKQENSIMNDQKENYNKKPVPTPIR
ncbi:MAG: hypothetical protein WC794_02755 [Candidatus Doudnabacteria bacterium]|jgi:hypothetical protein